MESKVSFVVVLCEASGQWLEVSQTGRVDSKLHTDMSPGGLYLGAYESMRIYLAQRRGETLDGNDLM